MPSYCLFFAWVKTVPTMPSQRMLVDVLSKLMVGFNLVAKSALFEFYDGLFARHALHPGRNRRARMLHSRIRILIRSDIQAAALARINFLDNLFDLAEVILAAYFLMW